MATKESPPTQRRQSRSKTRPSKSLDGRKKDKADSDSAANHGRYQPESRSQPSRRPIGPREVPIGDLDFGPPIDPELFDRLFTEASSPAQPRAGETSAAPLHQGSAGEPVDSCSSESPSVAVKTEAWLAEEALVPSYMANILGSDSPITASGYRLYLNKVLADAGNPTDPVERMLLEQTCISHLLSLRLHSKASKCRDHHEIAAYQAAATQLAGEVRKTATALKEYRKKPRAEKVL